MLDSQRRRHQCKFGSSPLETRSTIGYSRKRSPCTRIYSRRAGRVRPKCWSKVIPTLQVTHTHTLASSCTVPFSNSPYLYTHMFTLKFDKIQIPPPPPPPPFPLPYSAIEFSLFFRSLFVQTCSPQISYRLSWPLIIEMFFCGHRILGEWGKVCAMLATPSVEPVTVLPSSSVCCLGVCETSYPLTCSSAFQQGTVVLFASWDQNYISYGRNKTEVIFLAPPPYYQQHHPYYHHCKK